MSGVSAARMIGGNCDHRVKDDFYPTPDEVTKALIREWPDMGSHIWECACGDGAMSKVLERSGKTVVSTDLVDRGYGQGGVDFLMETSSLAPAIVPQVVEMIGHAILANEAAQESSA